MDGVEASGEGGPDGPPTRTVQDLVDAAASLALRVQGGADGLAREVGVADVVQPSRVATGEARAVPGAVLVLGSEDLEFLKVRPDDARAQAIATFLDRRPPAVVVTGGVFPPAAVLEAADAAGVPVFVTRRSTRETKSVLRRVLASLLSAREVVHGVLLQVHNVGVLIVGESGIGKSEAALELILRGHRLVADDAVELARGGPVLLGQGRPGLSHFMEVRGLGVLHAGDLFGHASVMERTALHLVVELMAWGVGEVDRTGLDQEHWSRLGVDVPMVRLPVRPGRNIALLIEVAARNETLKRRGIRSAERLDAELKRRLGGEG
ncbi:MAG: HPr(Ser) kinase/phosphatase [Alphaproteobacteria bacterium]|nr:HPr(Ser) kinase/phosphatase [Alphaproteobacteria bacterium]